MGVYTAYTVFEGDIFGFGYKEFGIIASVFKIGDDSPCDFSCVDGFEEFSVGAAFAGSVVAVTVVEEDFHCCRGQPWDSFAKVGIFC